MDFHTIDALMHKPKSLSKQLFSEAYEVIRPLGRGSFGIASLVKRRSDKRKFVAKELLLFSENGQAARGQRDAALNEVKVVSKLRHPNIVRYVDAIEQQDRFYLVLEYCSGGDLSKVIRSNRSASGKWTPMSEATIWRWCRQLLVALAYLHSKGLLHRDIKPANILLTSATHSLEVAAATIKLGDFGLSKILQHVDDEAATRCGTPLYFSPELCSGQPYSSKNDIWAVGCVLFELMTGAHPFDAPSRLQVSRNIMAGLGATQNPNAHGLYSNALCHVVRRMLEVNPSERPSAAEVLEATAMLRP